MKKYLHTFLHVDNEYRLNLFSSRNHFVSFNVDLINIKQFKNYINSIVTDYRLRFKIKKFDALEFCEITVIFKNKIK